MYHAASYCEAVQNPNNLCPNDEYVREPDDLLCAQILSHRMRGRVFGQRFMCGPGRYAHTPAPPPETKSILSGIYNNLQ